jgi:predicted MFS family arabinose efflux permease
MAARIRNAGARLRSSAARYRDARRSLHTPASWHSRYGLDWTNFFIADVQTGFGTFVAFYLAHLGCTKSEVGLALTTGTLAAVIMQIPGGALADAVTWKRALAAAGIVAIGVAALILALAPTFAAVLVAEETLWLDLISFDAWPASEPSIHLQMRELHHLDPLRGIGGDELGDVGGRVRRHDLGAEVEQPPFDVG